MDLKLNKAGRSYDNEKTVISEFYQQSVSKNNTAFKFAKLDNNFAHYLPYLKDGAVKLFLHYAMAANNETGESWYGIQTSGNKIGATDRSINNWNNELEGMGLIYRMSTGKKSKSTFLLPLTGFAKKVSLENINRLLQTFNLFKANEYTRIFGEFQNVTKLYLKVMKDNTESIIEIQCIFLLKTNGQNKCDIPKIKFFLYTTQDIINESLHKNMLDTNFTEKVIIVKEKNDIQVGGKTLSCNSDDFKSFFINDTLKIDKVDENIYSIMDQLTDNTDFSNLPTIS
ncbi:MAG: hypothetical protein HFE78_02565 [Clostridiales bacterium]|nr:hypothetical protein [Clostridiales bacterium]